MIKDYLKILSLCLVVMLVACADLTAFIGSDTGHLTTQTAVIEVIDLSKDHKAMSDKLTKWTKIIRKAVDITSPDYIANLSIADIDKDLRNEIITGDLAPQAKPLANQILTNLETKLAGTTDLKDIANQINPLTADQKAALLAFLDDIDLGVQMYGAK